MIFHNRLINQTDRSFSTTLSLNVWTIFRTLSKTYMIRCKLTEQFRLFSHFSSKAVHRFIHTILIHGGEKLAVIAHSGINPLQHRLLFIYGPIPYDFPCLIGEGKFKSQMIFWYSCRCAEKPQERSINRQTVGEHFAMVFHCFDSSPENKISIILVSAEREERIFEQVGVSKANRCRLCQIFWWSNIVSHDWKKHISCIGAIVSSPAERHQRDQIEWEETTVIAPTV